ncbi:hypothetical protein QG37_00954 [Candidozyma auris]|nr:hypothetical protein QG37_00954 [[Candida] auris]
MNLQHVFTFGPPTQESFAGAHAGNALSSTIAKIYYKHKASGSKSLSQSPGEKDQM